MKLSAYLMNISLNNSGEYENEGQVLIIDNETVSNIMTKNRDFKKFLQNVLTEENIEIKNNSVRFGSGDLMLALHDATYTLKANKKAKTFGI